MRSSSCLQESSSLKTYQNNRLKVNTKSPQKGSVLKSPIDQKFMPIDLIINYKIDVEFPSSKVSNFKMIRSPEKQKRVKRKVSFQQGSIEHNVEVTSEVRNIEDFNMSAEQYALRKAYEQYKLENRNSTSGKSSQKKTCCQIW